MITALDGFGDGLGVAANNFGDTRSGGLAGPMGLLIIVLLVVATVFLIRNMNARLRRLPDRFPDQDAGDTSDGAGGRSSDPAGPAPPGGSVGTP